MATINRHLATRVTDTSVRSFWRKLARHRWSVEVVFVAVADNVHVHVGVAAALGPAQLWGANTNG